MNSPGRQVGQEREQGPVAPPPLDFSTDHVREAERFDYFCEDFAGRLVGFDVAENDSDSFSASMQSRTAGRVGITQSSCSPGRWGRTRRSLLQSEESIVLRMLHSGRAANIAAGREFSLSPGSVTLFPTNVASEWRVIEPYRCTSISLPRAMVETQLRAGLIIEPTLFRPGNSLATLMFDYVRSYLDQLDQTNVLGEMVGQHIADLVVLALGANRDAEAEIAERGLKAIRIESILKTISESFASPFVSPATIGSAHGISERHVHRLLEDTNRTFYEHLLEARLSNAYRMLTDWRANDRPISDIAAASGFTNLSYFNREFRTRFGDTPTGVRRGRLVA